MHWTHRVGAYSLVAGSVLTATTGTTDAQIIYSGAQNLTISQGNSLVLNLDGDGFGDIRLKNYVFGGGNYMGASVLFAPGQLVGFNAGGLVPYVSNLAPNSVIGPGTIGPSFYGSMAYGANPNSQFNNASGGILGLSFPAGGNTYFGWVRVDINRAAGTFTVIDFAYESTPSTAILAGATGAIPEPSTVTLGLLAGGAAGLSIYRRRKAQQG